MSDKRGGTARRLAIAAGALALSALTGALIWRRVRPDATIGEDQTTPESGTPAAGSTATGASPT